MTIRRLIFVSVAAWLALAILPARAEPKPALDQERFEELGTCLSLGMLTASMKEQLAKRVESGSLKSPPSKTDSAVAAELRRRRLVTDTKNEARMVWSAVMAVSIAAETLSESAGLSKEETTKRFVAIDKLEQERIALELKDAGPKIMSIVTDRFDKCSQDVPGVSEAAQSFLVPAFRFDAASADQTTIDGIQVCLAKMMFVYDYEIAILGRPEQPFDFLLPDQALSLEFSSVKSQGRAVMLFSELIKIYKGRNISVEASADQLFKQVDTLHQENPEQWAIASGTKTPQISVDKFLRAQSDAETCVSGFYTAK